ncbi:ABC transporter permease [Pseudomonas cremoricolorata]|uniref:ABC transporter permease n=1 Tax=Pseudomonas cremoricolorata TaxID=157783 RepID=A0A089YG50_9PSED|nr:ABC transporter permease subunit [Pseudomonas cremoricolorata]AIR90663.1 ABC transporter permease [Pseudomonas cremoricolorata]
MNPTDMRVSPGAWLAAAIDWLNANFHPLFAFISRVVDTVLGAFETLLLALPAWGVIALVTLLALLLINLRTAVLAAAMLGFCWLSGLWTASMQTLALVSVSVLLSVLIAFPLGILAARFKRFEQVSSPVLNIMQTVPPWVYLIPAVMIFSLGKVPAIMATVIYGVAPMMRLTTLAFRQVPRNLLELGQALGATPRVILLKIEIPCAVPTLLVGLNQCILLSLAMVVLAGLVGAGGLGAEVTRGLTRMEMGLGLRAGLAIVAVALLLDLLSRGLLQRKPIQRR